MSTDKRRKLIRDIVVNKRYSFHPLTVGIDPKAVAERVNEAINPSFVTIQEALYGEYADTEGTSVWTSKSPGLWQYLPELVDYYDDGKFVYLVRDPRDVVLSFKTSNIELYHPYFSAQRWRDEQKKGIDLREKNPNKFHIIKYEELLQDPEQVIEDLCEFADLSYEEAMLYYYETEDAQAASESADVFENLSVPIKSDNFGKFRDQLPDEEVKLTEKIVSEEMEIIGYDRVYSQSELDQFEVDQDRFEEENKKLRRSAQRRFWKENPSEQIRRNLTTSFTAYMYLRYGVFA